MNEVKATTRTLGVLFPNNLQEGKEVGGTLIPGIQKETTLPVTVLAESFFFFDD